STFQSRNCKASSTSNHHILLLFSFFFFSTIRQPPSSTLFPTRRSSDLSGSPPKRSIHHCCNSSAAPLLRSSCASLRPNSSARVRSEEHTSELQSRGHLVCRLLLEKKKRFREYRSLRHIPAVERPVELYI